MEKRYQVFISSTYEDLKEERKAAIEVIIASKCFPAGMEYFPASSEEQFSYIKKVIDESDYFILITAGKIGSLSEDVISYTEKEFDYAVEKNIPILVFPYKDINQLPDCKVEEYEKKKEMLENFRKKVTDKHLAGMWGNIGELKCEILKGLQEEFKNNPRTGWVRADEKDSYEAPKFYFGPTEPENAPVNSVWIQTEENYDFGDEG